MGKVNPKDYVQRSDAITAEDIEEAAILTITEFADGDRKDADGKWALLKFEETENKILFLTDAALDTLVERYGDETDDWTGKKVPVERYATKAGEKVRIMATEEWDRAFKEAGVRVAARPAPRAAPATQRPAPRSTSGKR